MTYRGEPESEEDEMDRQHELHQERLAAANDEYNAGLLAMHMELVGEDLLRHLDFDHGIDLNSFDEGDEISVHEQDHDDDDDDEFNHYGDLR